MKKTNSKYVYIVWQEVDANLVPQACSKFWLGIMLLKWENRCHENFDVNCEFQAEGGSLGYDRDDDVL